MERDAAIVLCERSIRFDPKQEGVGTARALLKAGCRFTATDLPDGTTELWITRPTFSSIECGGDQEPQRFVLRVPRFRINYQREELIEICDLAIVPVDKWRDRDSPSSHENVGECWARLKRGDDFKILSGDDGCSTDERTIWVEMDDDTFYLPTPKRLEDALGNDWY